MDEPRVLQELRRLGRWDGGKLARCPVPTHGQGRGDENPNLSVSLLSDRVLLHCFAGCRTEEVVAALGCTMADLFVQRDGEGDAVTDFRVCDVDGVVRAIHRRIDGPDGKSMPWLRPDGSRPAKGEIKTRDLPLYGSEHLADRPGEPVIVTEGEKAAEALLSIGVLAVGTVTGASGTPGDEALRAIADRPVATWADNDDGGRKHMAGVAKALRRLGNKNLSRIEWADAPEKGDAADLVEKLRRDGKPEAEIAEAVAELRESASPCKAAPRAKTAGGAEDDDGTTAEHLVRLALERYRIGRGEDGKAFVVEKDGPNLALPLTSSGLKPVLYTAFRGRYGTVPNSSAFLDALATLEGEALAAEPEKLHLRVAPQADGIVVDLGTVDGRAVVLTSTGWDVVERSPVLFKRTELTGESPDPIGGGDLEELRRFLRLSEDAWSLAVAWMLAALLTGVPCPLLLIGGTQGGGKTFLARVLVALTDPSPAPIRSQPTTERDWSVLACSGRVHALDNVSKLPLWFQDALCKVVSGEGRVSRKLYTDCELAVLLAQCAMILTSIDPGALRGDLADRLVRVELERIPKADRRTERELLAEFERMRPRMLGALLDLLVRVVAELPNVDGSGLPRMADFGRLLRALDRVQGWRTEELFLGQRATLARDVVEGDPVGEALLAFMDGRDAWEGTAGELRVELAHGFDGSRPPPTWPKTARGMVGALQRLESPLRQLGVRVERGRESGGTRSRFVRLLREEDEETVPTVPIVPPEVSARTDATTRDDVQSSGEGRLEGRLGTIVPDNRPPSRPEELRDDATTCEPSRSFERERDGWDDRDGCSADSRIEQTCELLDGQDVDPSHLRK